jgi:vancomycin resistance protein VanW
VRSADEYPHILYISRQPIARCDGDPRLEAGKRHNVRLAAPSLDGVVLGPDRPLSFWRAVGRPTRGRGFRHGMELRGGCIVPTVGGGLCLLTNALFRMACELGWQVLERAGHTLDAAPIEGTWGVDATAFWPFVDLRIAPRVGAAHLGVVVAAGELVLQVRGTRPRTQTAVLRERDREQVGDIRTNRIERDVVDIATGRIVATDVVAINRKRVLTRVEQKRNCFSCDELDCHARPRDLEVAR